MTLENGSARRAFLLTVCTLGGLHLVLMASGFLPGDAGAVGRYVCLFTLSPGELFGPGLWDVLAANLGFGLRSAHLLVPAWLLVHALLAAVAASLFSSDGRD
jgi:hypothetical protein